jgi:hypothetical protein
MNDGQFPCYTFKAKRIKLNFASCFIFDKIIRFPAVTSTSARRQRGSDGPAVCRESLEGRHR